MPERLRRLDEIFADYPIYFITACTHGRRSILADEDTHDAFAAFVGAAADHGAWVGEYVLMPDHMHLFVTFADGEMNAPRWVKSLKNALSKTWRERGIEGPHWQKGFFDHVLRGGGSYTQKWHYVRENPVRKGLAESWEAWPYRGAVYDLEFRDEK